MVSEKKPLPDPPPDIEAPPPSYTDAIRTSAHEKQSDVLLHLFLLSCFLKSLDIDPAIKLTEPETFREYTPEEPAADPEWVKTIKSWVSSFIPSEIVESEKDKHKKLQWRLTLAARRFIIFISALDLELASSKNPGGLLHLLYPPIDVLFCWYSFMLRPRTFLHEMRSCAFESFTEIPFPLERVARCINKSTLKYEPSSQQKESFLSLTLKYMSKYEIEGDIGFQLPQEPCKIKIFCPSCGDFLALVDLTNKEKKGFADNGFRSEAHACSCGFGPSLDHNNLQIRQLYNDAVKEGPATFIKTYHPNLTQLYYRTEDRVGMEALVELRHHASSSTFMDLASHQNVSGIFGSLRPKAALVARQYCTFNLIHATISQYFALPIHTDLVALMFHLLEVILTHNNYSLITNPNLWPTIDQAEKRYKKFIRLHGGNQAPLIPTIDIDLVWRTRRLDTSAYFEYCLANAGRLLNYDVIDSTRLYLEYNRTATLYRKKYKEKYTSCTCDFCKTAIKLSFSIFSKPKVIESLVKWNGFSLDHLSCFDQVAVHLAQMKRLVSSAYPVYWAYRERYRENFAIPYRLIGRMIRQADFGGACGVEDDWLALSNDKN